MDIRDRDLRDVMLGRRHSTRLSISLDGEAARQLEEISSRQGMTKSQVLRAALMTFGYPGFSEGVPFPQKRNRHGSAMDSGEGIPFPPGGGTSRAYRGPEGGAPLVPVWITDTAEALVVPAKSALITPDEHKQLADLSLLTTSLVSSERRVKQGALIKANTVMWHAIVDVLRRDWSEAYRIPPEKFEELIAGAFEREGYDNVILTHRSADDGRDVIATTQGAGCVKIIASVKRYAAHRPVRYDDVRALLGVMASEPDASKGMVITTSTFPVDLPEKDHFKPFIPTRLELMDGERTLDWLSRLRRR